MSEWRNEFHSCVKASLSRQILYWLTVIRHFNGIVTFSSPSRRKKINELDDIILKKNFFRFKFITFLLSSPMWRVKWEKSWVFTCPIDIIKIDSCLLNNEKKMGRDLTIKKWVKNEMKRKENEWDEWQFFCFTMKWNSSLLMSTSSFSFLLSLYYRNFRTNNARVTFIHWILAACILDIAWCLLWVCVYVYTW